MTPETISKHRRHLKMKRAQFARTLGVAPRTLKAYEDGTNRIPKYIALAIQAVRQESLESLCRETLEIFVDFKKM